MADISKLYPNYNALQRNEIRLLELHPGARDVPLKFSLKHASLDEHPQYEAISYVWGNGADLHTITFEERQGDSEAVTQKSVTVTRNLRDALHQFRDPTVTRVIWADALCINQQSLTERASQVRLMRDIYVKAHRVLLWLGLEDEDTGQAIEFLTQVAEFCEKRKNLEEFEKVNVMGGIADLLNISQLPQFNPRGTLAASRLFTRPWFSRVWVVQEVSAGQDVLVYVGSFMISFSVLGLGALWLRELQFLETGTGAGSEGQRNASIMWQRRFSQRENPADLLDDGRDLLATDARDKVYGLLGFQALRNTLSELEPDYEKTVQEIYTETAIAIIERTGSLDVLSFAEAPPMTHDPTESTQNGKLGWPNCPSWVARWDEQTYFPTSAMCTLPPYKDPKGPSASIMVSDAKAGIIKLKGLVLDEVVYIGPYLHWPETANVKSELLNPEAVVKIWEAASSLVVAASETDVLVALAQTLTGGLTADYQPTETNPQEHAANFISFMLDALSPYTTKDDPILEINCFVEVLQKLKPRFSEGDPHKYQMAMCLMCSCRRAFITGQGHMGIGHSQVLKGDSLVWLYGGKLPFLLRSRHAYWEYVGESYVYNVKGKNMHGDWLYEGLEEKEFELH